MRVRELPPLRESHELITPSGARYRWATDDPNPANIPSDVRSSDTIPGGFETGDVSLARRSGVDYKDLERFTRYRRLDASSEVIFEGRLERAPRVSGDRIAINPSAVGYQTHLEDNKAVRAIYRDTDLSRWGPISSQYRLDWPARTITDPTVRQDETTGEPGLWTDIDGGVDTTPGINPMALYDARGVDLGSLYYAWKRLNVSSGGDTNYNWYALLGSSDRFDGGTFDNSGDLQAAGPDDGTLNASTSGRKFAAVGWEYLLSSAWDRQYAIIWTALAVYGNNGLTLRGTEPDAGFYDADIIRHAIGQWCPLLSITDESVTADPYIITQAAFLEPTTVGEIVRQVNRFRLRDWAVWEGPVFWLHDRGARGRRWRARVAPSGLEETGPQADRLWESIMVQYQDVDGSTRTVGPPGSGANTETEDLKDSDPDNPANQLGITRRDLLVIGTASAGSATEVGRRFLEETRALENSGRARFVGHVEDEHGVIHPYTRPRAGDQVAFVDAADTSYRRIVRADKSASDMACAVDLDAPPEGLQAILEQLNAALLPLGLG